MITKHLALHLQSSLSCRRSNFAYNSCEPSLGARIN